MSEGNLPNFTWIKENVGSVKPAHSQMYLSSILRETAFDDRIFLELERQPEIDKAFKLLMAAIEREKPVDIYQFCHEFFVRLRSKSSQMQTTRE